MLQETNFFVFSLSQKKKTKKFSTQFFLGSDKENACAKFQISVINFD